MKRIYCTAIVIAGLVSRSFSQQPDTLVPSSKGSNRNGQRKIHFRQTGRYTEGKTGTGEWRTYQSTINHSYCCRAIFPALQNLG